MRSFISASSLLRLSLFLVITEFGKSCFASYSDNALFHSTRSSPKSLRLELRASNSVTADAPEIAYGTNNGLAWKAPITIGGQVVELNIDTGSSYPWVFGPTLPKNETTGHSIYDPTKSHTFANGSSTFSVAYVGDYGANGYVGYDTITVGNLTILNTTIGVATQLTGDVVFTGSDGILGLEPDGVSSSPFISAVFQEVEAEILTFDLRNDSTGTLDFGYVDSSLFEQGAQLTTIPLGSFGWTIDSVSYAIDGKVVGNASTSVDFDTGGEVMAVDDATAAAYWAPLVANGSVITTIPGPFGHGTLYVVPCSTELPELTIIFGDVASPYGNATISGDTLRETSWPRGDGSCIGSVWSYPDRWIGAPFFFQYVVSMDYGSKKVVFGPKASR